MYCRKDFGAIAYYLDGHYILFQMNKALAKAQQKKISTGNNETDKELVAWVKAHPTSAASVVRPSVKLSNKIASIHNIIVLRKNCKSCSGRPASIVPINPWGWTHHTPIFTIDLDVD